HLRAIICLRNSRAGRQQQPIRPISLNLRNVSWIEWMKKGGFPIIVLRSGPIRTRCIRVLPALLLFSFASYVFPKVSGWRQATDKELASVIPARATVINERIETEMRTASGVTDGHGKFISGVVMITAGYSAEGKYSYFLSTQVAIKIADIELK